MKTSLEIMQRLALTNSRIEKEQILVDAFMNECFEFFEGIKLALDPLVTFGVKKVAEILEDDDSPGDFTFEKFLMLTNLLKMRRLTGHAARDAINEAAQNCHVKTWNLFYRRILLKDLGVGVDESTVNKILKKLSYYEKAKEFIIPVFTCQLAQDGEDPKHQKKIKGTKLIDYKLDGVRILAVMNETINLFSRNGQLIETFPEVKEALKTILPYLPGPVVLDGELISPKGFQHLMTLIKRKESHPDTDLINYALFDIVPMNDFFAGYCSKPQKERSEILAIMQQSGMLQQTNRKIYVIPQLELNLDTPEGQIAFNDFNRQAIDGGYEGIMIKDPEAPYEGKRTAHWLKKKPIISVTLAIVGFEPGKEGKYQNTLGALVCKGFDNDVEIQTNVSGFSDELRDQLWKDRENLLGMMVEIIADKMTLEEGSSVYSLRFPRFAAIRGRVPGEKL